ncbi:MAG: hypothetical protein KDJ41_11765 [Hyphomicrobiaceae bacterium]|nr:hypothetical protein [Hyphomicrobiaceae bacterium]
MALQRIKLELARDHDHPNGSRHHGYDFIAPLDDQGHLVVDEWRTQRERCRVKRFWEGNKDEIGHLVRKPGGSWAFHYDVNGPVDSDESGYRFGHHVFKPGEYVSIKEHDGEVRTFRVISVQDLD